MGRVEKQTSVGSLPYAPDSTSNLDMYPGRESNPQHSDVQLSIFKRPTKPADMNFLSHTPRDKEGHVRTQQVGGPLKPGRKDSPETSSDGDLIFDV